jgi:hypothetical protein
MCTVLQVSVSECYFVQFQFNWKVYVGKLSPIFTTPKIDAVDLTLCFRELCFTLIFSFYILCFLCCFGSGSTLENIQSEPHIFYTSSTKICSIRVLHWDTVYMCIYSKDWQNLLRPFCENPKKYERGGRLNVKIHILLYGDISRTVAC